MEHAHTPAPAAPAPELDDVELERRRREQAARLGCFTEQETAELTGHTVGTLRTYRRRRTGLPWVRIGPEVLYPIEPARKLVLDRVQHPREATADAL